MYFLSRSKQNFGNWFCRCFSCLRSCSCCKKDEWKPSLKPLLGNLIPTSKGASCFVLCPFLGCNWCLKFSLSLSLQKGHVGRILNITSSPDGVYVATAGSDETLRLWKCFEPDVQKSSSRKSSKKEESSRPRMNALR